MQVLDQISVWFAALRSASHYRYISYTCPLIMNTPAAVFSPALTHFIGLCMVAQTDVMHGLHAKILQPSLPFGFPPIMPCSSCPPHHHHHHPTHSHSTPQCCASLPATVPQSAHFLSVQCPAVHHTVDVIILTSDTKEKLLFAPNWGQYISL